MPGVSISKPDDPQKLLALFQQDPVRCAYMVGTAEEAYFPMGRWTVAQEGERVTAVLLVYQGMSVPSCFAWGRADHVSLLVDEAVPHLSSRLQIHVYPEFRSAWGKWFDLSNFRRITRMSLTRDRFRPVDLRYKEVFRLTHEHTQDLLRLYQTHPDTFFEPAQIESGYCFGIQYGGQLASVAVIHLVSEQSGLAVLGNVLSAPWARGKGFAQACVSRICSELFDRFRLLVLDVPMENQAAATVFQRQGFRREFYYEKAMVKRDIVL